MDADQLEAALIAHLARLDQIKASIRDHDIRYADLQASLPRRKKVNDG